MTAVSVRRSGSAVDVDPLSLVRDRHEYPACDPQPAVTTDWVSLRREAALPERAQQPSNNGIPTAVRGGSA